MQGGVRMRRKVCHHCPDRKKAEHWKRLMKDLFVGAAVTLVWVLVMSGVIWFIMQLVKLVLK